MSPDTVTAPPFAGARRPKVRHALHAVFPVQRTIVLAAGRVEIGRGAEVAFPDDRAMSRQHAAVTLDAGKVAIEDLDSHNGTWHRGARVGRATLADGDGVRLGDTLFVYRVEPVGQRDAAIAGLSGHAPAIRQVRADLADAAPTAATVVLLGETGTGKTLAARALHAASGRRGELVHVNCAAIPEAVSESALFGHKAGAFTDAKVEHPGYFRAAQRGTLFLDEVGLLSPATQARLLVAIESGAVTPVGGVAPIPVDVRLVVATNEDLAGAAAAGRFRPDLYARLAVVTVTLPPLRDRREDVLPLFVGALGKDGPALSADAADLLLRWRWPYNVREVEKLATELRVRSLGEPIGPELLPERMLTAPEPEAPVVDGPPDPDALAAMLREVGGNVTELARRVGRSTKQVYRWCSQHGLDPGAFRG